MHREAIPPFDALVLMKDDHRLICALLSEIRRLLHIAAPHQETIPVVEVLAKLLRSHLHLENEFLFPAVGHVGLESDDTIESLFDQEDEQYLIEALEAFTQDYCEQDEKLSELSSQLEEHIRYEEEQLFPKFKAANADLSGIGFQMLRHRVNSL